MKKHYMTLQEFFRDTRHFAKPQITVTKAENGSGGYRAQATHASTYGHVGYGGHPHVAIRAAFDCLCGNKAWRPGYDYRTVPDDEDAPK